MPPVGFARRRTGREVICRCLTAVITATALVPAADLVFDTTAVDLFPEPGVAVAVASFPCRNAGAGPLQVAEHGRGCACTGWSLLVAGKPATAIPAGATAVFQLGVSVVGGSQGRQWKSANFVCTGDGGVQEIHTLRFSYDTGSAIQLTRKCLYWDVGEAVAGKASIFAVRPGEDPIHIIGLTPKNGDFRVDLHALEDGRRYEIRAVPVATTATSIGSVEVHTDSRYEAWRSFSIFLLVTRVQH